MDEKKKRYNFDGFTFGDQGHFQLQVRNLDSTGYGWTVELGLELTTEERLELITVLINLGKNKED